MKTTVSIGGREMGDLTELMEKPTAAFKEAMARLVVGEVHVTPRATATELAPAGYDYSQIDEGIRDEVRDSAARIHGYARNVASGIVAIGKRLEEVKHMLPHGQFTAWVEGEFGLSARTAQNYMNVAREYGDPQKAKMFSFFTPSVLYLLAAPSTPEAARIEVETAAGSGQPVTFRSALETIAKHKPPREVKRVRDEVRKPKPTEARAVYVEPEPTPTESDAPTMPADLAAAGYVFAQRGDGMWAIVRPDHDYESFWRYAPADCIDEARRHYADEEAAVAEVAAERAEEDGERAVRDSGRAPYARLHEIERSDFRVEHAIAVRGALLNAREMIRRYYHELTGCETDTLPFDRSTTVMLGRINDLLMSLGGEVAQ